MLEHRLREGAQELGVSLGDDQVQRLVALIQLLAHWSRAYNLTAVRDPLDMVAYHLLDSLALVPYLRGNAVLDLGTGAGFPGLPLAIACPEQTFTLLDSTGKKIRFVRQAVLELGLRNVQVVQSRIESYKNEGKFVTIVARALAVLPVLLRWVEPLLRRPGVLLAPKGHQASVEIAPLIPQMDPAHVRLHRLNIPYIVGARMLVEIDFV